MNSRNSYPQYSRRRPDFESGFAEGILKKVLPDAVGSSEDVERNDFLSSGIVARSSVGGAPWIRSRFHFSVQRRAVKFECWDLEIWQKQTEDGGVHPAAVSDTGLMVKLEPVQPGGDMRLLPLDLTLLASSDSSDPKTRWAARLIGGAAFLFWLAIAAVAIFAGLATLQSWHQNGSLGVDPSACFFLLLGAVGIPLGFLWGHRLSKQQLDQNRRNQEALAAPNSVRGFLSELKVEGKVGDSNSKRVLEMYLAIQHQIPELKFNLSWKDSAIYFYFPWHAVTLPWQRSVLLEISPEVLENRAKIARAILEAIFRHLAS